MSCLIERFYLAQPDLLNTEQKVIEELLRLITLNDQYFYPPISQRTTLTGYLDYLLGKNQKYIEQKYGRGTPPPEEPFILYKGGDGDKIDAFISCFTYFSPFEGGYIIAIMTDPEKRKNGFGKLLTNAAIEEFIKKGVNQVSVTTWSTNLASRRLFESYGFQLYNIVPDERALGIDGLYFRKKL